MRQMPVVHEATGICALTAKLTRDGAPENMEAPGERTGGMRWGNVPGKREQLEPLHLLNSRAL